ncbi:DUF1617 family protein [Fructilactobacillus sp. Tb1]|uniref:DUF1617 family protein n=1 Tax=Fructilactobacillus sp. Tb1 TaxID=3422304 RepID=UPI003D2C6139
MQIKLTKGNVEAMISFLEDISLSGGKVNRARFRFIKLLNNKLTEINEDRLEIAKGYANLDKNGTAKIKEDGTLDIEKSKIPSFSLAQNEMYQENALITVDDYVEQLQLLFNALINYENELQGNNLIAYGVLLDAFEDAGFTEGK